MKPGLHCDPVSSHKNHPGREHPPPGKQVDPRPQVNPSSQVAGGDGSKSGVVRSHSPRALQKLPPGQSRREVHLLAPIGAHRVPPATHLSNGPQDLPPPQ
ncbi:hypothetical protein RA28_01425 [Ruegeria sp. ANG-S4]|nr:hypothetical protein RA28_01425 [Ruegeria sp. ANG-S4]